MTNIDEFNFICEKCYDQLEYTIEDGQIYIKQCKCVNERTDEFKSSICKLEDEINEMDDYISELKIEIEDLNNEIHYENECLKNEIIDSCKTNLDKVNKQYEFMYNGN